MRWNAYHQAAQQLENRLHEVAAEHNRLFVELREIDGSLEAKRAEHKIQQQRLNSAQGDYYSVVGEVSRLEQAIKHNESSHAETCLKSIAPGSRPIRRNLNWKPTCRPGR